MSTDTKPNRRQRLTTLERRAKVLCETIQAHNGLTLHVEWRRSRTWGMCPVIYDQQGDRCAYASGCGYDKLSAVLADAMRWLGDGIHATGGCGVGSVIEALAKNGWHMGHMASGRSFDVFTLSRIGA